jgi:hypothetical protein
MNFWALPAEVVFGPFAQLGPGAVPRSGWKRSLTRRGDQTASPIDSKILKILKVFIRLQPRHSMILFFLKNLTHHHLPIWYYTSMSDLDGLHRFFLLKAARIQWQAPSQWKDTATGTKRKNNFRQHLLFILSRRNLLIIQILFQWSL